MNFFYSYFLLKFLYTPGPWWFNIFPVFNEIPGNFLDFFVLKHIYLKLLELKLYQAFSGHQSLHLEISQPGTVIPVFLFNLNPRGSTLTFLLVLSTAGEQDADGVDLILGLDSGRE